MPFRAGFCPVCPFAEITGAVGLILPGLLGCPGLTSWQPSGWDRHDWCDGDYNR
jgi:hypothetical protein